MKQRVLTAALLIPPVLLAVFVSNPYPLLLLAFACVAIGSAEVKRLTRGASDWYPILGLLVLAGVSLLLWMDAQIDPLSPTYDDRYGRIAGLVVCLFAAVLGFFACLAAGRGKRGPIISEFASLWLGAGVAALVLLHGWPKGESLHWKWDSSLLLALIPLWIGDSLAIFAGRAFGKHLLAPKISPKKTVEGGAANLIGCIVGAIGVALLIGQPLLVGVLAGLATGILGQAGDLLESAMKRSADLKDSGTLLPGHGGILDRIDSILLSAPWVALIVTVAGYTQR